MEEIRRYFEAHGYPAELIPAGQVAVPQLKITIGEFTENSPMVLELMQLPQAESSALFQFFVPISISPQWVDAGVLARTILYLNEQMPINGFGINEANRLLYFRFLLPLPADFSGCEIMLTTTRVIAFLTAQFGLLLTGLAQGTLTMSEVYATITKKIQSSQAVT